ncbi:YtfJ family protein [Sulfurimonas sp.]|nr:YtfJ family protein [Sulfurimonas sp.]
MIKKILTLILLTISLSALPLDKTPKKIIIEGDNGGYVQDGSPWNSSSIKDKVYVMFYVDPDERTVNDEFSQVLKEKNYNKEKFGSIAVINLAATWKPNIIIEKLLQDKQEEFPETIYIKDKNSILVNEWGLQDDSSEIILFSKDSKVIYYKSGKMSKNDIEQALQIIEENR